MRELLPIDIEARLILEAIHMRYGYDFRSYAYASIKRRLLAFLKERNLENFSELLHRLLHNEVFFGELLLALSVNVTEMFRDPEFYLDLRRTVIPELKKHDHLKIWHAGCASGEEVYSMAILLREEGLLDRTQIYATDFNEAVLHQAREGIYPNDRIRLYTQNYQLAGGTVSFSDYYTAGPESSILDKSLRENIVFADHNLATDAVFGEMDLIFCRNVLIYFDKNLQDRVLGLFYDSLAPHGLLCLGSQESARFSKWADFFLGVSMRGRVYRIIDNHEQGA